MMNDGAAWHDIYEYEASAQVLSSSFLTSSYNMLILHTLDAF